MSRIDRCGFARIAAGFALGALLGATFTTRAPAEEASDETSVEESTDHRMPLGNRTRAWLARQRNNEEASEAPAGLTPPAERRARMRYLDSFEHPIPDLFEMDDVEAR